MANIKIIVEKHTDGYAANPLGLKGAVVGQGGTFEEALDPESPVLEAFVAEATVSA